jgi:hypothetical protein
MIGWLLRPAASFQVPCTLEIEQTHDFFHAHLELDGDIRLRPGDQVRLLGAPVRIDFGESLRERRLALVARANWLVRLATHLSARFALGELYDVSFSGRRLP